MINIFLDRLIEFSRNVEPAEMIATYQPARALAHKVRYVQAALKTGKEPSATGFAYTSFRDTSDSHINRWGYYPPSGVLLDDAVSEDVLHKSTDRFRALQSSNTSVRDALLVEIGLEEMYALQSMAGMKSLGERIEDRQFLSSYLQERYSCRDQNRDDLEMERLRRNGLSFLTVAQLQRFEDSYEACLLDVGRLREQLRVDRRARMQTLAVIAGSAATAGIVYALM